MAERSVTDVDRRVGQRMRGRRLELNMSQLDVAQALGIAPQQVQKYERGANRISASRLYDLSETLDLPIARFFDGLPMGPDKERAPDEIAKSLATPEGAKIALLFARIKRPTVRRRMVELLEAMADGR